MKKLIQAIAIVVLFAATPAVAVHNGFESEQEFKALATDNNSDVRFTAVIKYSTDILLRDAVESGLQSVNGRVTALTNAMIKDVVDDCSAVPLMLTRGKIMNSNPGMFKREALFDDGRFKDRLGECYDSHLDSFLKLLKMKDEPTWIALVNAMNANKGRVHAASKQASADAEIAAVLDKIYEGAPTSGSPEYVSDELKASVSASHIADDAKVLETELNVTSNASEKGLHGWRLWLVSAIFISAVLTVYTKSRE